MIRVEAILSDLIAINFDWSVSGMEGRMIHSFQTEIAEECGVEAAIIFANIQHWIKHNSANGINLRDGHVWTYNSRAAWCEQFPYMGEKQIRNAIEALVQAGLVIRGNFSGGNVNRTYWYRLAERAEAFGLNGQTKFGRKGQTITDNKPDEKQTIPPTPKGEPDGFEEIWKAVWKRGGGSQPRQPAARAYAAAIKSGAKHEVILAAVKPVSAQTSRIRSMHPCSRPGRINDAGKTRGRSPRCLLRI